MARRFGFEVRHLNLHAVLQLLLRESQRSFRLTNLGKDAVGGSAGLEVQ